MGDDFKVLASIPDRYRKARSDRIKLRQQEREDAWRQEMGGDLLAEEQQSAPRRGEFVGPPRSAMGKQEYTNPSLEYLKGNTSTQEYLGAPQRVDSQVIPERKISPEIRASGGAAAVLDGQVKPGINPAVTMPGTSYDTPIYPQSNLLKRPLEQAPIAEEQGPLLAGDVPRGITMPKNMSNERMIWMAERDKKIGDAVNALQGKPLDPYQRAMLDMNYERIALDREKMARGNPMNEYQRGMLDLKARELEQKIERGEAGPKEMTEYQKALIELRKQDQIAKAKGAKSKDPGVMVIDTVDDEGNPIKKTVPKTPGQTFKSQPKSAKEKDITVTEQNAAMFYNNADNALRVLEDMESRGYRPGLSTAAKTALVPDSLQGYALSADEQRYIQAAEDFTAAKLRLESGASIPQSEISQQARIYMIRPGDSPETIKQKNAARKKALEGLRFRAGRGADMIKQGQTPAISGPQPGDIDGGYRFKGGDPADPKNWEPQ